MSSTITVAPQHSTPLARTTSPFKNPRPPPCIPAKTEKIWDEYERRAVENARRRDNTVTPNRHQAQQRAHISSETILDIVKQYGPQSSPRVPCPSPLKESSRFNLSTPPPRFGLAVSTTVATCKTCKSPIVSDLGICERCKKTIILSSPTGEITPPPTAVPRNFGSTDLLQLAIDSCSSPSSPVLASPVRQPRRSSATQLLDPPVRLSSLRPPPPLPSTARGPSEIPRPRKASLPDAKESLLRLQLSRRPVPLQPSCPTTPTTPPSTSHSNTSTTRTRPSSLANLTTPPETIAYRSTRHSSATPSELSSMFPYIASSTTTTSPPSICRTSYQLQNTMSAWEDSDSEDEENVGLVKYWKVRRWRGSRGSLGGQSQARRDSAGNEEQQQAKTEKKNGWKRRGFVRVISCGCTRK